MNLTYFKRYRMQIELSGRDFARAAPEGYRFWAWEPALLDVFAAAKYQSFRDEIDANVFPCLGEADGCRRLMGEIAGKPGFLPGATWLAIHKPTEQSRPEYCGTVQGIRVREAVGSIQNLGITPPHRGLGLGTSLLFRALEGFRQAGLSRVYLEVTAQNEGAIRLYDRLGFTAIKTVYKTADVAYS